MQAVSDISEKNRMRDLVIWKLVGGLSAINGLICFALSSTYDMSFGKLGFGGHLVYLLVGLITWCLFVWAKRIRVSQRVQGVVAALIFVIICVISVVHDKLVAGKSDALSIISYGSFALMSVSMSRKLELGFETGFSTFFLQLFAAQLYQIKRILLPIALVFSSLIIILRHYYSESGVQSGSITANSYHPIEVYPPNASIMHISDEESIDSPGQSLLSTTNNEENNQEESSQAMHHSTTDGQVSMGSRLDWDSEQNDEPEETRSSFSAVHHSASNYGQVTEENMLSVLDGDNEQNNERTLAAEYSHSSEQDEVSSGNNRVTIQNGGMYSPLQQPLLRLRRRVARLTAGIQYVSSSVGDTLGRWHWPRGRWPPLFLF